MSWRHLNLERPRWNARFRWRDRILSSMGLALGVFFLILSWGLITPTQELIRRKVLGSLPDRFRVSKPAVTFGPLAVGGGIPFSTYEQVQEIPGVEGVFRQAHLPKPCQARATYGGQTLVTDLVVEMCDSAQVINDVAKPYRFEDPGPDRDLPLILPEYILDLVNSGIVVNTNLPQISRQAVIGKHATLSIGTSSFRPGQAQPVRCIIVGVSDQIGQGGPAIPYEAGLRLGGQNPEIDVLTVKLRSPQNTGHVLSAIESLGLHAPRLEFAQRTDTAMLLLRLLGLALPGAVLLVTAIGLSSSLELQVTQERQLIALYRAIGATPGQASSLYLVRALSVACLGLTGGTLSALIIGRALALWLVAKAPPGLLGSDELFQPSFLSFALATIFSFGVCLLAGWLPARSASRIEPAQAFREPS